MELQFERSTNDAAKKCPLHVIRSANQPQLGLAKSPSMMVTSCTNGRAAGNASKASNGALLIQRSLSVNNENANSASESNSTASNSDSDNEKERKDKLNIDNKWSTTSPTHGVSRGARVVIPKFDDEETFEKFFVSKKIQENSTLDEDEGIDIADFDKIKPTERYVNHINYF